MNRSERNGEVPSIRMKVAKLPQSHYVLMALCCTNNEVNCTVHFTLTQASKLLTFRNLKEGAYLLNLGIIGQCS